ncbi:MAG: site-specific integrase [Gracilimonas sp.]|uniref:site-specific integrase n=1 Tax=Gracilimonas sp. TaxID=1974203 RepID=UPI0019C30981|nr:site-specific integrase [Gracilimonas sp.]MBD3615353.1 site-specific integrase [Gracilimonas sp.]
MFNTNKYFYIRNDKVDQKGLAPIYLRLTNNSGKVEIYTKQKVKPEKWDTDKQRCTGREYKAINFKLDQIQSKVADIESKFLLSEEEPTLSEIKKILTGKREKRYILDYWDKYLDRVESLIGRDYSESTYKKYRTTKYHFRDFLTEKVREEDILFTKIDSSMVRDFMDYLKIDKDLNHNTTIKYMKNFKVVVDEARKRKWLNEDPFLNIEMKYQDIDRQYLTSEELKSLEEKEFDIERLERIKDFFLFSCYTGLAYSDISALTPANIKNREDVLLIETRRQKTDIRSIIPLNKRAVELLDKYGFQHKDDSEQIFPVPSNQNYNAYLKEVADLCGIKKELCTHDARRTFATTVAMDKGVSLEGVSLMLGHSSIDSTKIYAKVTDEKVIAEMKKAGNI